MVVWLLEGLGDILRAASSPLWGLPGLPRAAMAALAGSGGPGHSFLWIFLWVFLLPVGGNRGRVGLPGPPSRAKLEAEDPPWEAGAAAGLYSCSSVVWASPRPIQCQVSPLH